MVTPLELKIVCEKAIVLCSNAEKTFAFDSLKKIVRLSWQSKKKFDHKEKVGNQIYKEPEQFLCQESGVPNIQGTRTVTQVLDSELAFVGKRWIDQ